jgi:hypothetical protein
MQKMTQARQKLKRERQRMLTAYREVVHSVREARTMQGIVAKERQIRRLMHHLSRLQQA